MTCCSICSHTGYTLRIWPELPGLTARSVCASLLNNISFIKHTLEIHNISKPSEGPTLNPHSLVKLKWNIVRHQKETLVRASPPSLCPNDTQLLLCQVLILTKGITIANHVKDLPWVTITITLLSSTNANGVLFKLIYLFSSHTLRGNKNLFERSQTRNSTARAIFININYSSPNELNRLFDIKSNSEK